MRHKKNFRKKISYAIFPFLVFSFLFILFFQINTLVKERSLLKSYTGKIIRLSKENEDLEMNLINKNGLGNVEKIAQGLNFEKTEKIHYIRVLESAVAAK